MDLMTQALFKPVSPWKTAARIRGEGRAILQGRSGRCGHRLTFVLALVTVLTAAIALYMAVACMSMAGDILFGEAVWVDAVASVLLVALCLGLILPLIASVYRLACLMAAPDGTVTDGLPVSVPAATLAELFYPFTSFRAYGRTLAVAMEGLGFTALTVGLPILLFRLVLLSLAFLERISPVLSVLAAIAAFLLCLTLGLLAFFLSGRRAGFGYFVFTHEEMPLSDVHRYYKGFRRPLIPVLCLRVSLLGWFAFAVVAILVPLVGHVLPYSFCCAAVYSRELTRK